MDVFTSARASSLDVSPDLAWGRLVAGGPGAHWYLDALPLMFRATLDRLLGGEPLVRPPDGVLTTGDRAGFWTVEHAEDGCLLMVARVKAPGSVRIGCELTPEKGGTRFRQEVSFHPGGPLGVGYLLADLPAREVLIQLLHSRTRRELIG
ncbi:hypothetical protein GCM10011519_18070 [Marmoricola endophyticus]|uniref:DUF2867 domain-containing protein n=1 Tax=Marmoricola endophyticus TaxID=2040280 RepID=A0A917BIC7_9ACTN|nr:DUF2867 domain-containing protein [Marmoricola endophyticus]GGF44573.1 hypothetical protein GCM10011519_18070 [Marmoricola endophyticus]